MVEDMVSGLAILQDGRRNALYFSHRAWDFLPPLKLTNQPVLGCCYFSDRRQETPGSETGSLNAYRKHCAEWLICVCSQSKLVGACTHTKLGDGHGMWNLENLYLHSKSTHGTSFLFLQNCFFANSAQGTEVCRAVKIEVSRILEAGPHLWQSASSTQISKCQIGVHSQCQTCQGNKQYREYVSKMAILVKPSPTPHSVTSDIYCLCLFFPVLGRTAGYFGSYSLWNFFH